MNLLDDQGLKIIRCVMGEPLTMSQIGQATGLPNTTIYRKVPRLHKDGYLVRKGTWKKTGDDIPTYQAITNKICLNMKGQGLKVSFEVGK